MADPRFTHSHRWKKRGKVRRSKSRSGKKGTHLKKNASFFEKLKHTTKVLLSRGFLTNLALLAGIGAVLMFLFVGFIVISNGPLPDPDQLVDRSQAQSTQILDRTGEHVLYEIHGDENRTFVTLEQIPEHVQQALLSAEDDDFYEHHGIAVRGIIRSVLVNTFTGSRAQGASTITQQLVKNAFLTPEKTYTRKLREIVISLWVETRYTKEEIFQMYFNEIPFGSTNYGIESASRNYYGKTASELTLAEGATLVSMLPAPTRFMNNPDQLETRRNSTLDKMVGDDFITQEEADAAKAESTPIDIRASDITAPHFVFYVKELLEDEYGQVEVEQGGLRVVTTIDFDLQEIAEEEVAASVAENGERLGFSNAALVGIDPKNGHVLSMVGSHDYFDEESDGAVNVATRLRQPGSSIKPIAYTALFNDGYTPNTVLYDTETDFPSDVGPYHPRNYNLQEKGPVTVRTALQGSLNIPAVKALYLVGVQRFLDFAETLGYTSFDDRSRFGLALVLGGGEVTLLEHTSAYATFANEGVRNDTVAILQVDKVKRNGVENLYTWEEAEGERVLDSNVARMITNVLADDPARRYAFGAGSNLQLGNRPVAAKTGTTNDYRDAWTMGYTPSLAVGVWGGNNDNSEMVRGAGGSSVAAPIWNAVMRRWYEGKEIEYFTNPAIPELGKPVLDGVLGQTEQVLVDRITGKRATDETPVRLRELKTFVTHHSILHYINRGNITGDVPREGQRDPQYAAWEAGVQAWVQKQVEELGGEFVNEEPPEEFDDVHIAANIPDVEIQSPSRGDTLNSRTFTVDTRVSARRQVARVEAYIDGYYVGATENSPYQLTVSVPSFIKGGQHTLKVSAFDDVENEGSDEIRVTIPDNTQGSVQVVDPRPNQVIVAIEPTYQVRLELDDPTRYDRIEFFAGPRAQGGGSFIGSIDEVDQFIEAFTWTLPGPGEYILTGVAQLSDGTGTATTGSIIVLVQDAPPVAEEEAAEAGEEE